MKKKVHALIAKNLRELRHEKGISQENLSFALETNDKFIGHIERGERRISLQKLIELAEYFDVPMGRFFEE